MHEMYLGHIYPLLPPFRPYSNIFPTPFQLHSLFFGRKTLLFEIEIIIAPPHTHTVPPLPSITFLSQLHGLCLLSSLSTLSAACIRMI